MSNIVNFSSNLPVTSVAAALKKNVAQVAPSGGIVIIKMDRTGHWVFGADQTEVETGTKWAVNPLSFLHGFIAWGEGTVLAEKMAPMTEPLPELDEAPTGAAKGWEPQVGVSLKCLSGDEAGMDVRFTTTSMGGKRAIQELAVKVAEQIEADQERPVAIITLARDHYQHKQYGRIYTPVFNIDGWMSMTGEDAPQIEEASDQPKRRRPAA
jgi:hypothetical protein